MRRREFLGAAALVLTGAPLAAAARPRRRLVVVTADLEAHVALVDPVTGTVVRRLATTAEPRSAETLPGGRALLAHTRRGVLSVVDVRRATVTVVADRMGEPRYTAVHPDGRHAYVSDSGRGEVAVLDLLSLRIVARVPVGGPARHIGLDPSGRHLWTVLGNADRRVVTLDVRDPGNPRVTGTLTAPFPAHDVVHAPTGGEVWLSSGKGDHLAVLRRRTGVVRLLIPGVGRAPQHIAFTRGGVALVTTGKDGTLRRITPDGRGADTTRSTPVGSYNVTAAAGLAVSPSLDRGTLVVMDGAGRPRRTIAVSRSAHDACIVEVPG